MLDVAVKAEQRKGQTSLAGKQGVFPLWAISTTLHLLVCFFLFFILFFIFSYFYLLLFFFSFLRFHQVKVTAASRLTHSLANSLGLRF